MSLIKSTTSSLLSSIAPGMANESITEVRKKSYHIHNPVTILMQILLSLLRWRKHLEARRHRYKWPSLVSMPCRIRWTVRRPKMRYWDKSLEAKLMLSSYWLSNWIKWESCTLLVSILVQMQKKPTKKPHSRWAIITLTKAAPLLANAKLRQFYGE